MLGHGKRGGGGRVTRNRETTDEVVRQKRGDLQPISRCREDEREKWLNKLKPPHSTLGADIHGEVAFPLGTSVEK